MLEAVVIDFDYEPLYGRGQAYVSYPVVFPTVTFRLKETPVLERIADSMGVHEYEFYIGINGYTDSHLDPVIIIDADEPCFIDLTENEQELIYNCLNTHCIEHFNKDCEKLLLEAEERNCI